jgi:WD40 repeat protein
MLMKTWVQKIRATTLLQFADNNLHDLVPLDGGMQPIVKEEERFNLSNHLHTSFIGNPERKNTLLIGTSGAGKTWFGQNLVMMLPAESSRISLWIRLTSIDYPWKKLLNQHLNELKAYQIEKGVEEEDRLTDADISEFFQIKPPLFLVLDGYDELPAEKREHQYYQENKWNDWGNLVQVLMTSRLEALPKVRAHVFSSAAHEPFTEYYIQPFNKMQLEVMVRQYCATHRDGASNWDAPRYLEQLTSLYELREFISSPFLVKIVLDVLPTVFEEVASTSGETHSLLKKRLTRYNLYKKFLEKHFARESDRLVRIGVGNRIEKDYNAHRINEPMTLPQLLEKFTDSLARAMFNHHVSTVKWHPAHPKISPAMTSLSTSNVSIEEESNQEWLNPYFDDVSYPHVMHLRSGSPIIPIGFNEYAFLHYSILEFYAAEQLFNGALQDSWYLIGRNLNKENLQTTPDILKALAARIHEEPLLKEKLFEIIEQSKYAPELWRAAANAITLLNCAGARFSGLDFKRIRIGGLENPDDVNSGWGADLSHSVLSATDLSEADLRYVNFTQAHLVNTILTGACLDGVNFGEQSRIEGITFSFAKDGLSLATVLDGNRLQIYRWPSREPINAFQVTRVRGENIEGIAFHPAGQEVAIILRSSYVDCNLHYKIICLDLNTKYYIRKIEYSLAQVIMIKYSPEGTRLAAVVDGSDRNIPGTIIQWDLSTGKLLPELEGLKNTVHCFAYSPDGSRLASVNHDSDYTVRQWNAAVGQVLQMCEGHTDSITSVVYHPKGRRLASSSFDSTMREWEVTTGKLLQIYEGHIGGVACVAYHPNGSRLVSAGEDNTVREWDVNTGTALHIYEWTLLRKRNLLMIREPIIYSPDGGYLIFSEHGLDGIRQYNLATAMLLKARDNHSSCITSIAYSHNGARIASAGDYYSSGAVREWDVITGNLLHKHDIGQKINSVTYSNHGRLAAGGDHTIWQRDITTSHTSVFLFLKNGADRVVYSQDGARLASAGSHDEVVQQLNSNTGTVFCLHTGLTKPVRCVAYNSDGTRLVAGGSPRSGTTLQEWDAITGESLRTYNTSDSVWCVTYSHDGLRLASGHFNMVQEWDIITGALLRTFNSDNGLITSIMYSPNSRYLAFGDYGIVFPGCRRNFGCYGIIHIATIDKANSSKVWFKFKNAHPGGISALAWSPDSAKLATGGDDHAVRLWRICDATGKINPILLWQTHSSLTSRGLTLHQATGLSDENYKLLVERSSDEPLKGKPANSARLTSKKVLAERNSQIHLPEGKLIICNALDRSSNRHIVTPTRWLVSIMRNAPKAAQATAKASDSNIEQRMGGHVHLLVAGMTPEKFTIFREIHFFRDTDQPSSGFLFYASGKGLISIRHIVPYDLLKQLEENTYIAKSWSVEPAEVERLFENIERDSERSLNYVNIGQTLFGEGYSCLTFCEKHLTEMDHDGSIGIARDLAENKPWYNFMVALPSKYLPPPTVGESEPTIQTNCVVM